MGRLLCKHPLYMRKEQCLLARSRNTVSYMKSNGGMRGHVRIGLRGVGGLCMQIVQEHLSGLCANLYQHTITDVQTSERVSLLLKESFIESFSVRDRPFMKQFVETQTFSVYSDSVMR